MMTRKRHGFGRAFFLCFFCCAASAISSIGFAQTPADQAVAQARAYAGARLTKQALEILQPLRAELRVRAEIARIHFAAEDWDGAVEAYSDLHREFPADEVIRRNLLVSLYRAESDERARELLAQMGPEAAEAHPRTLTIRGLLAARAGRVAEAVEDLEAAAAMDGTDTFAVYELGVLQLAEGDAAAAASALQEAARRNPELSQAWYNLGQALARAGRTEQAREALDRAGKIRDEANAELIQRQRAVALAVRGQEAQARGEIEAARRDFEEALKFLPGDESLIALLAGLEEGS